MRYALLLPFLAAPAFAQQTADAVAPESGTGSGLAPVAADPVTSENWMVAAANPLASEAGAEVLRAGGFTTGGTNFDAKLRRQSLDPEDLLAAHVGGMDVCARGLKAAAAMHEAAALDGPLAERYAGWDSVRGRELLSGKLGLDAIAERVQQESITPQPHSGRQERLENVVNRYV